MPYLRYSLPLVMLAAAACADSSSDSESELRRFEGIYEVQLHAFNEQACSSVGGAPIEDTERFMVATVQKAFGTTFLQLASCASPAACRDLAGRMESQEPVSYEFGFTLTSSSASQALTGFGASSGYRDGNVCKLGDVSKTTLISTGDDFRIEKAITIADDYAAKDGWCDTNSAQEAANGNTCSQMETLTATLVEPL